MVYTIKPEKAIIINIANLTTDFLRLFPFPPNTLPGSWGRLLRKIQICWCACHTHADLAGCTYLNPPPIVHFRMFFSCSWPRRGIANGVTCCSRWILLHDEVILLYCALASWTFLGKLCWCSTVSKYSVQARLSPKGVYLENSISHKEKRSCLQIQKKKFSFLLSWMCKNA